MPDMMIVDDQVDTRIDTRIDTRPTAALRRRKARTNAVGACSKAAALGVCRALMISGRFQPTFNELKARGITKKVVQRHFGTLGELHTEALDEATRVGILGCLMPNGPWPSAEDCSRILRGVVVGRVTQ
jgi:hypothetical protein